MSNHTKTDQNKMGMTALAFLHQFMDLLISHFPFLTWDILRYLTSSYQQFYTLFHSL